MPHAADHTATPFTRLVQHHYTWVRAHRWQAALVLFAVWGVLLWGLWQLRLNNTITVFLPDDAPAMRTLARGMDVNPLAQFVSVDLHSNTTGREGDLAAAARAIVHAIPAAMATPVQPGNDAHDPTPSPDWLFALLPTLFDANMQARLTAGLTPEAVQKSVHATYTVLTGFPAPDALPWLRTDPLQWRDQIIPKLPQQIALPPPDAQWGYPLSDDGTHLLLLLRPTHDLRDAHASTALMDALNAALAQLPEGIQGTVVGGIRHTAANTLAIDNDIKQIGIISLLGMFLIYALWVRSWGAIWLLLTPLVAVSSALGILHYSVGIVSGLALGFGAAVLGIAEDYAVHVHFALRTQADKSRVFAVLSTPLLQGLLLNASGFAVLLFSAIPALRQLALFALLALTVGFLLALFVLPHCPGFDRPFTPLHESKGTLTARMPRPVPVFLAVCVCIAACYAVFTQIQVETSPHALGAESKEILQDTQQFVSTWHPRTTNFVLVEGSTPDEALTANARVLDRLRHALPPESAAQLFGSSMVFPPRAQAEENLQRWQDYITKNTDAILHAVYQAGQTCALPPHFFEPFAKALHDSTRPRMQDSSTSTGLMQVTQSLVRSFPHEGVTQTIIILPKGIDISGKALSAALEEGVLMAPDTLQTALQNVFAKESVYIPCTLIICMCLLYVGFGNVRQSMLALLPPLCALLAILLGMYALGTPLTIAGLAALPLVFGLAVDHGIMVTHDLATGMPLGIEKAVIVSSLTACVGMGLLAFASHPALRSMGQVIFLGLAMEVPASLWLLPLFCSEEKTHADHV